MAVQFPDPNVTQEFEGPNGVTYVWDDSDNKWVVKTVGSVNPDDVYLKKKGDTIDDAVGDVTYKWNNKLLLSSENEIELRLDGFDSSFKMLRDEEADLRTTLYSEYIKLHAENDLTFQAEDDIIFYSGSDIVFNSVSKEIVNREINEIIDPKQITTKEYVDAQDAILNNQILELEEEIDAIAPSVERGQWFYDTTATNTARDPQSGHFYLLKNIGSSPDFTQSYDEANGVVLHNTDKNAVSHGWADVEIGKLIQLYDSADDDYILGEIVEVVDNLYPNSLRIKFDLISSKGSPTNNSPFVTRLNIFDAPSGGGDVSGFVMKTGDKMSGTLRLQYLQGWRPTYDDSDPRIVLHNTSWGATMEWGANRPRINWDETGGNLFSGHGSSSESVIAWKRSDVNDRETSQALYYGAITEPKNLVHKEYVDDKIAELLAKIEELEMSGTPTSYSFRMKTKRYGASSSIGQYMSKNELCSCDNDGDTWSAQSTYGLQAERKSIYVCFEDGYQLNSTGYMHVIKSTGNYGYDRSGKSVTLAISEVEVCPPNKADSKNIYRAVVQIDALKESTGILPSWSDNDYISVTFTGGSVTKVS